MSRTYGHTNGLLTTGGFSWDNFSMVQPTVGQVDFAKLFGGLGAGIKSAAEIEAEQKKRMEAARAQAATTPCPPGYSEQLCAEYRKQKGEVLAQEEGGRVDPWMAASAAAAAAANIAAAFEKPKAPPQPIVSPPPPISPAAAQTPMLPPLAEDGEEEDYESGVDRPGRRKIKKTKTAKPKPGAAEDEDVEAGAPAPDNTLLYIGGAVASAAVIGLVIALVMR